MYDQERRPWILNLVGFDEHCSLLNTGELCLVSSSEEVKRAKYDGSHGAILKRTCMQNFCKESTCQIKVMGEPAPRSS